MRPDHPEARNLRREEPKLFADGVEEGCGASISSKERRRVLAAHGISWVVVERCGEVAPVDVKQSCKQDVQHQRKAEGEKTD